VNAPVLLGVSALGLVANLVSLKFLHGAKDHRSMYARPISTSSGFGRERRRDYFWTRFDGTGWQAIDPVVTNRTFLRDAGQQLESPHRIRYGPDGERAEPSRSRGHPRRSLPPFQASLIFTICNIWSVGAGRTALSAHLIAREAESSLAQANTVLESQFGIGALDDSDRAPGSVSKFRVVTSAANLDAHAPAH